MSAMTAHFVHFLSPGTFVSEETAKPIDSWDAESAKQMAMEVSDRHGATPYGFFFTTRSRSETELDSKQTNRSNMYFLGGKVETLAEIEARNNPKESILRSNMRNNGYDKVIVNTNSYKITVPLREEDVVLDFTPPARKTK